MKIARKQVLSVMIGEPSEVIVTFSFDGSTVTADYHDDSWRSHFESGIYSPKTGRVTPSDGAAFWEALDIEFVNSTHTDVIKLP